MSATVRRPADVEPACFDLINAARYLDVPMLTLRNWLDRGVVPFTPIHIGRKTLLVRAELDQWLAKQIEEASR
jgi:excisionase family DNA binding protein